MYLGDFPANHTAVCIPWDSFAAATGAPTATTNFAASDIQIYKDGGTTQRSSSAGITVSTSFDGSTGLQMVAIDLSDNTDAGFYAAGHEYQVAVADVTIDTQTVRFWAGCFSIERALGALAVVKTRLATASYTAPLDAAGTRTAVGLAGANLDTQLAALQSDTDNIQTRLPAALTGDGNIKADALKVAGATPATLADVNAEMVDVIAVDTYAEPGQGAPAATTTLSAKLNYLFKMFRNKKTQSATEFDLYADDATTVDQKSAVSDSGSVVTRGEMSSGP